MADDRLSQVLPWLIYTHEDVQTFSTEPFNNKSYVKSVPILQAKNILGSQFGWLFLKDEQVEIPDANVITLWNPFTSKSIEFPPLFHQHDEWMSCFLTSDPIDEDHEDSSASCFLFLFFDGEAFSIRCPPTQSSCWVSKNIEIEDSAAIIKNAVALNGVIYGYGHALESSIRYLVRIDVVVDDDDASSNSFNITTLSNITLPNPPFFLDGYIRFMVESRGFIYMVQMATRYYIGSHAVKIFELDLGQGVWTEVDSLGDRAFFLGDDCCTWCSTSKSSELATTGNVEGNCVYFHHRDLVDDEVVLYRLDDCSSTFLPCPGLRSHRRPCWVMPPYREYINKAGQECNQRKEKDNDDDVSRCLPGYINPTTICKEHNNDEIQENYLFELPLHLIELISRYMHLFDYWNFRCSSKMIQSAVLPAPRCSKVDSPPLLLVFENNGGKCQLIDPCRDDSRPCIFQLSHHYFDIEFSKDGWLLVLFDKFSRFYFNPFTKVTIKLPRSKCGFYYQIGFSTHPACSKGMTVAINKGYESKIVIDYLRNGDVAWTSCRFDNINPFTPGHGSPVYHSGAFYFIDTFGYLGVFTLVAGEAPSWTVYDKPFAEEHKFHSCHLVVCGEELVAIFIDRMGTLVRVFRFNESSKNWVPLKSLGNYIVFISPYSTSSTILKEAKMKNRIYLPCLSNKGNRILYYSLDTRQYHVHDDAQGFNDYYRYMKHPSRCCWI